MNGLHEIVKVNLANQPDPVACPDVTEDDATNFDIVAILAVATIWLVAVLFSIGAFN